MTRYTERLLAAEAAAMLGITQSTLKNYLAAGGLVRPSGAGQRATIVDRIEAEFWVLIGRPKNSKERFNAIDAVRAGNGEMAGTRARIDELGVDLYSTAVNAHSAAEALLPGAGRMIVERGIREMLDRVKKLTEGIDGLENKIDELASAREIQSAINKRDEALTAELTGVANG